MKDYFVYIITNKGRTVLYTGVTNSLVRRITQHREGKLPGFTQSYRVKHMMYFERFGSVTAAIVREKQIKRWNRKKKEALIRQMNPDWADLAVTVLGLEEL